jgi:hypothetical protein
LLQVEVTEIIVHEADEPNALVSFLDSEPLAGQHGRDVHLLAVQADAAAGGDEDIAIMEGIGDIALAAG